MVLPDSVTTGDISSAEGCCIIVDEDDGTEKLLFDSPETREVMTDVIEEGDHEFSFKFQFQKPDDGHVVVSNVVISIVEHQSRRVQTVERILRTVEYEKYGDNEAKVDLEYHTDYVHQVKISQPVQSEETIPFVLSEIEVKVVAVDETFEDKRKPPKSFLSQIFQSLIMKIGGPIAAVLIVVGAFLIPLIVGVILYRVWRKKVVVDEATNIPIPIPAFAFLPNEEEISVRINRMSLGLKKAVMSDDSKQIERLSKEIVSSIQLVRGNIERPHSLLLNILDLFKTEESLFTKKLKTESKWVINDLLQRAIEIFIKNCPGETLSDFNSAGTVDVLNHGDISQFDNVHVYRYTRECVIQGLRMIQDSSGDLTTVVQCLRNLKNTKFLLQTLIGEIKKIPQLWFAKIVVFRFVSYSFHGLSDLMDINTIVDSLLEMIPLERTKLEIIIGMIYIMRDTILDEGVSVEVKIRIWFGTNIRHPLQRLLSFFACGILKSKNNRIIRGEMLKIGQAIREYGKTHTDIPVIVNDFERELVCRYALEPSIDLRGKIEIMLGKISQEKMVEFFRKEKKVIETKFGNERRLLNREKSTVEQKKIELSIRSSKLKGLKEIAQKKMKVVEERNKALQKSSLNRKKVLVKIKQTNKQLNKIEDGDADSSVNRETLGNTIVKLEEQLDELKVADYKYTLAKNKLLKEQNKVDKLQQKFEKEKTECEEMESEITDKEAEIKKTTERLQQLSRDYKISFNLQFQGEGCFEENDDAEEEEDSNLLRYRTTISDPSEEMNFDKDVPCHLKCPISLEIMSNPVLVIGSGRTYEEEYLIKWLKDKDTDPVTRKVLVGKEKEFVPNYSVKLQINEWVQKHRVRV